MNASFAANRAASEARGFSRSPAAKRRSRNAGVRVMARSKRARSTTSTPMPAIAMGPFCRTGLLLDGDRLRQVARLVDVEALGGSELHPEDVERHDGQQRLEQRGGER